MTTPPRKFDPTWMWVVIGLLVLHSCAVDDAIDKLSRRPASVNVDVNPKVDK